MSRTAVSRTVVAAAFVLDTALIGTDEASRRVIESWQPGASLRRTPSGHWLLLLTTPVRVRVDGAPGWPITAEAISDRVTLPLGVPLVLADLPEIDPHLDLGPLSRFHLVPIQAAPAAVDLPPPPADLTPDLRKLAHIKPGTKRIDASTYRSLDRLWNGLVMVGIVALAMVVATAIFAAIESLRVPPSSLVCIALIAALIGWSVFGGLRTSRVATPSGRTATAAKPTASRRPSRLREWIAQAVLTSPFAGMVTNRQAQYLRDLERAFQRREWERALRDAVPLGGSAGILSLSVPQGWRGPLSPSTFERRGGSSLAVSGIQETFTELYRRAAEHLEQAGEIEKAAYVLADLLNAPIDAVQLLERHGHHLLAARLADGRHLEPALVVRLWWRAGERQRAIDVAELRGAFAAALERIGRTDDELSRRLRTAWVRTRREAGDHLGALAAAWPDPRLRPDAVTDIQAVMALGGAPAAQALAYLINLRSDDAALDTALALLSTSEPSLFPARDRFLAAFVELSAADPVHDRRLATAAVRSQIVHARTLRHITPRADRLAVADLPKPVKPTKAEVVRHSFALTAPGDLPVYDAAWLNGRMLLAHGGHGAHLVTATGRELARWDIPTHRIIAADSGTHVLLVTTADGIHEFHQLDLITRRTSRWAALRATQVTSTYDGSMLAIVDGDGIAFLRTTETPRIIWRELDAHQPVISIARSAGHLSALVGTPAGGIELWRWDTPSNLLLQRPQLDLRNDHHKALLGSGTVVTIGGGLVRLRSGGNEFTSLGAATAATSLLADGDTYGIVEPGRETTVVALHTGRNPAPFAVLTFAVQPVGMSDCSGHLLLWDGAGRVVAIDVDQANVAADFRTTIGSATTAA